MVAVDDVTYEVTHLRPSYYRIQELTRSLRGTTFSQRRTDGWWVDENDWLLEFAWPTGETTLAAWTTRDSHYIYNRDWGFMYLTGTPIYLNPVPLPEPKSFVLMTIAGLSLIGYIWRKQK